MTTNQVFFRTAVFPARYIQGQGALGLLPEWINRLGHKALIVAGNTAIRDIIPTLKNNSETGFLAEAFRGECTVKEIERITAIARTTNCDVIVALGGGKVIDTVKAVANGLDAKTIIAPTIASNDAPCSAVSVIYTEEGIYDHAVYLKQNPNLVLLDSGIIAKSPVRQLVAGMGDALSTWFEADACYRSGSKNEAEGYCTLSALNLARLCYETILEYGKEARESCIAKTVTPALEKIIEANTLMSGLGFESAGLASAHSIHNGLTKLPATHSYFHGEKVAFGVLSGLFLSNRSAEIINEVYSFCESVGLPVTLEQLGILNPSEEDLKKVAEAACTPSEFIWHEPVEVTVEKVVESLREADDYGKARSVK
ncbi:MAG: glycerol dehydrogenase [Bacteroidota bacterium]|jgi:glycerol dehydrogenase